MGWNILLIRKIAGLLKEGKLPEALTLLDTLDQMLASMQWTLAEVRAGTEDVQQLYSELDVLYSETDA